MTDASSRSDPGPGRARPSIWARPERGRRGPVPAHSRDAIVASAIALADAEGIAAVSMRAVANRLDTGAGSLYRYLSSRDDLLDLMADHVVGELRPYRRAQDGWLDAMLRLAGEQLALYRRHRWLLDVMERPSVIGPEGLAWFDHCLETLEPLDCAATAKFEAIAMMTGVVGLVARSESAGWSVTFTGLDLAAHPHLAAAFRGPPGPAPRKDLLERTLRGLLTGLLVAEPPEPAGS